jgi:hypothetical protein
MSKIHMCAADELCPMLSVCMLWSGAPLRVPRDFAALLRRSNEQSAGVKIVGVCLRGVLAFAASVWQLCLPNVSAA